MVNCLFCKIAAGEIPSAKVYEDDHVFSLEDEKWLKKWHKRTICVLRPAAASDFGKL